jgi:para-aminobenzoate synthetase
VSAAAGDRTRGPAYVIGVDGRSGTGKTTLAEQLADALTTAEQPVPVVHLDDVYPGWDGLAASVPALVEGVLQPLARGEDARWRRWDWAAEAPGGWAEVAWAPTVVVEGVGATAAACRPYLAGALWLEADDDVRYRRAIDRDGEGFAREWDRWAAQEDAYLAADSPAATADVVVRT